MKFGKNIGRVVELSDPEWSPFWINYKFLKKKVKALEIPVAISGTAGAEGRSDPQTIARCAGEVEFYTLLRKELQKCSEFFTSVLGQFTVRQARVKEGWLQLRMSRVVMEGNPNKRLMAACVKLYKDLLLLENYAIMNYCGFSKILKKHDKVTGFRTRQSFMKSVVNRAPFVHYPELIDMLHGVEALFKDIEALPSVNPDAGVRVPLREEQLFIDTMRTINTEAFRLQQEEGADIGLNTSEFSKKRDCLTQTPAAMAARVASHSGSRGGLDMVAAAAAEVVARATSEAALQGSEKVARDKDTSAAIDAPRLRAGQEVSTHANEPALKRLCTSTR